MRSRAIAAVGLGVLAALAVAGQPPKASTKPSAAQDQRIAKLCQELGQGQYGSQSACRQLIAIGKPAMPRLLKALKDPRPQARWWAVAAVATLAADDGYDAVLGVLRNDRHSFVRSTAVYYLRHFRKKAKKDIWPAVEEALMDKDPEVGRWALRLMYEDSDPPVKGGYKKLDEALRKVLAHGAGVVRAYALEHIRGLLEEKVKGDTQKAKTYLPLVKQLLSTRDPRVRYDAVHTAVLLMDKGQADFLREVYEKDTDPTVREGVLRCVTVIPNPPVEVIEILILGLGSDDLKVRDLAARLIRKGCKRYFGYNPKAPLDERRLAIDNWTTWYQAHRAKLRWEPDLRKFLLPGERPADAKPKPRPPSPKGKRSRLPEPVAPVFSLSSPFFCSFS